MAQLFESKLIAVLETFVVVPILAGIVLYGPQFITDTLGATSPFAPLVPLIVAIILALAYQLLSPQGVAVLKDLVAKKE